jgi:hypothetical protein
MNCLFGWMDDRTDEWIHSFNIMMSFNLTILIALFVCDVTILQFFSMVEPASAFSMVEPASTFSMAEPASVVSAQQLPSLMLSQIHHCSPFWKSPNSCGCFSSQLIATTGTRCGVRLDVDTASNPSPLQFVPEISKLPWMLQQQIHHHCSSFRKSPSSRGCFSS